jgi:hypothetical protein
MPTPLKRRGRLVTNGRASISSTIANSPVESFRLFILKSKKSECQEAKFFFADNRTNEALYDIFGGGNPLQAPGWPTEEDIAQRLLSMGVSPVLTNRLVNEVRFGWSTIFGPGNPSQPITSSQLGISSPLSNLFPGMPTLSISYTYSHSLDDYSGSGVSDITLIPGKLVNQQNLRFLRFRPAAAPGGELRI